jgi:hypothetical protein
MIASYLLFPFVSGASGLMPEFSSEMAGVVTGETIPRAIPGAIVETEGMPTGFTGFEPVTLLFLPLN